MLTTLLAPKKKHVTKPLIEVVCTDDTPSGKTDNEGNVEKKFFLIFSTMLRCEIV